MLGDVLSSVDSHLYILALEDTRRISDSWGRHIPIPYLDGNIFVALGAFQQLKLSTTLYAGKARHDETRVVPSGPRPPSSLMLELWSGRVERGLLVLPRLRLFSLVLNQNLKPT